jgi:hypothetical protein
LYKNRFSGPVFSESEQVLHTETSHFPGTSIVRGDRLALCPHTATGKAHGFGFHIAQWPLLIDFLGHPLLFFFLKRGQKN